MLVNANEGQKLIKYYFGGDYNVSWFTLYTLKMDALFFTVKLSSVLCCIVLGVFLLVTYVPKSGAYRNYIIGRRCLAASYFLLALATSIVLLCNSEISLQVCVKYTLSIVPPIALCLLLSFIVLIYLEFPLRKFLIKQLLLISGFDAMVTVTYFWPEDYWGEVVAHYVSVVICCLFIVYYIKMFNRIYVLHAGRLPEVGDKRRDFLRHIKYAHYSTLGLAFVSVIINIYPNRFVFLAFTVFYTLYFFLFTLVYVNYVRFLLPEKKKETLVMSSIAPGSKAETEWEKIDNKINQWLKEENYLSPGITIDRLSKDIGVNRTYLSSFINTSYQTNFNTWINGLRIEASKKIIQEDSRISLSEVADRVGFVDASQFSKRFKQLEGISPSQWRSQ